METTPIEIFSKWFGDELNFAMVRIPTACSLSTIGIDNYPNARFVSLKGIVNNNFITGTVTSRQGLEINETNKVAPIRIEFLEFKPIRFHDRKLYQLIKGQWTKTGLQP